MQYAGGAFFFAGLPDPIRFKHLVYPLPAEDAETRCDIARAPVPVHRIVGVPADGHAQDGDLPDLIRPLGCPL